MQRDSFKNETIDVINAETLSNLIVYLKPFVSGFDFDGKFFFLVPKQEKKICRNRIESNKLKIF